MRSALLALVLAASALAVPGAQASAEEPANLTPVNGASTVEQATVLKPGRYLDHTVPADKENVYRLRRTMEGSTFMFGVTLRQESWARANRVKAVLLHRLADGRSRSCGQANYDAESLPKAMPVTTQAGYSFNLRSTCGSAAELVLVISAPSAFRVPVGTAYELDVREEPPVTNVSELDYPTVGRWVPPKETEPTKRAEAAPSMAEAAPLTPDESVHVDLPLGRPSWFTVPVEAGAHIQALASTEDPSAAGSGGAAFEVRIVSPVGGMVDQSDVSGKPFSQSTTLGSGPASVGALSWVVSPALRTEYWDQSGTEYAEGANTGAPGSYYVVVYAQKLGSAKAKTLPVTLTATTPVDDGFGTPVEPAYKGTYAEFPASTGAKPAAWTAPSEKATPKSPKSASADDAEAADEPDSGRGTAGWVLIGALLALSALFAMVGTARLRRQRG